MAPPVDASLDLDRFNLENLDTKNTDARTTLQVLGRLAGSPVSVNGWANAFRARPSLDLQARIDDLSLSTFSPYFGPESVSTCSAAA